MKSLEYLDHMLLMRSGMVIMKMDDRKKSIVIAMPFIYVAADPNDRSIYSNQKVFIPNIRPNNSQGGAEQSIIQASFITT